MTYRKAYFKSTSRTRSNSSTSTSYYTKYGSTSLSSSNGHHSAKMSPRPTSGPQVSNFEA